MRVDLEDRLSHWADQGLISADQVSAIRARETQERHDEGRSTLAAEAVGYLGAALALVAGGLMVGRFWDRIELWGRLTLVVTIGVVTFVAGWWVRDRPSPAAGRLVSLLWFATVVAAASATAIVGSELFDLEEARLALLVGGAVSVVAAALYAPRRRTLQQLALLAGVVTVTQALLTLPDAPVDPLYHGLLLWATGTAWFLLAVGGWLAPRAAGVVLGGIGAGLGLQVATAGDRPAIGLTLALTTTATVGVLSVVVRSPLLLGFAVAGTFLFVPRAVFHFFGDSLGAPFALFLTGIVLIGVAVGSLRLGRDLGGRG